MGNLSCEKKDGNLFDIIKLALDNVMNGDKYSYIFEKKDDGTYVREESLDISINYFSKSTLQYLINKENPVVAIHEALTNIYEPGLAEIIYDVIGDVFDEFEIITDNKFNYDKDTIREDIKEYVFDRVFIDMPYDEFFTNNIRANLFLNTGDGNFDFTLNNLFNVSYCENLYISLNDNIKKYNDCIQTLLSMANEKGLSFKTILEELKEKKIEFNVTSLLYKVKSLNYDMEEIEERLNDAGIDAKIKKDSYYELFTDFRDDTKNNSSLVWLVNQQGYSFEQLEDAIINQNFHGSKLLESIYNECKELTTHLNSVTFLLDTDLSTIIGVNSDDFLDEDTITISKDTNCGLYDWWNGAGSLFELKLEKDVVIPKKFIGGFMPERYCDGYNIDESFALIEECWNGKITINKKENKTEK